MSPVIFVPYVVILLLSSANYFVEILPTSMMFVIGSLASGIMLGVCSVEVYLVTKRYRNEADSLLRGGS